jgi:hypothetical protein
MLGAKTDMTIHDYSARLGTGEERRKFLVDKAGVVRARFAPMTKPERLVREVAGLL